MWSDVELAELCHRAYILDNQENFGPCQLRIEQEGESLVLCFVGSDDKLDWLCNLSVRQVKWHYGGKIHSGFDWIVRNTLQSIRMKLKRYTFKELVLTGHSLGGALSIAFSQCFSHYKPCVVTFGAPNLFNSYAVAKYKMGGTHYINGADPIPHLPSFRYQSLPNRIQIGYKSKILGLITPKTYKIYGALVDHKIESYIESLNAV